jgi:alpha-N-arabinofuranosidase
MNLFKGKTQLVATFTAVIALNGFSQNSVTLNVGEAKSVVAQEVFGLLMERLGRQWTGQNNSGIFCGTSSTIPNTNGMRNDVIDAFKEAGVGAVQWPGGCAANGYTWQDNKKPSGDVGVDRFIQFCKLTGAEAMISGKPTGGDAASNLAFAQYIINDLKYPLKWFKIGNEIWGGCGTNYTNGYSGGVIQNTTKMKELRSTENGKDLKFIVAAGAMEGNYSWIPSYYTSMANDMNAIEYHDYVYHTGGGGFNSTNPTTANYWQVMNDVFVGDLHSHVYNDIIPAMKRADPTSKVKICLDEWGDWFQSTGDGWMQTITVLDAISAGGHLNQFISNADIVGAACLAQGVNVIHSIVNINTSGVMVKTPALYVFKMYKPHHANNAKCIPATAPNFEKTNSVPAVNVAGTVDANGVVNVSFVNVDLSATRKVAVTLSGGRAPYTVMSAEVVTGPEFNSTNPFGGAEQVNIKPLDASSYNVSGGNVLNVTLPSKSVSMVRLLPDGYTSTLQQNSRLDSKAFSIKSGTNGTIFVSSNVNQRTPATISLYSVNGKSLIGKISGNVGTGTFAIGKNLGKGIYIIKVTSEYGNFTKQIAVSR